MNPELLKELSIYAKGLILNFVVQLPLLAEDFTIVEKRLVMTLLSFFTVVVTMCRLRKTGSTVQSQNFIISLSKTTYRLSSMPMG